MSDAQIFMIDDSDYKTANEVFSYSFRYKAAYLHSINEGQLGLDGVKKRNSDDNSLKNYMQLHSIRAKYDEVLRVL